MNLHNYFNEDSRQTFQSKLRLNTFLNVQLYKLIAVWCEINVFQGCLFVLGHEATYQEIKSANQNNQCTTKYDEDKIEGKNPQSITFFVIKVQIVNQKRERKRNFLNNILTPKKEVQSWSESDFIIAPKRTLQIQQRLPQRVFWNLSTNFRSHWLLGIDAAISGTARSFLCSSKISAFTFPLNYFIPFYWFRLDTNSQSMRYLVFLLSKNQFCQVGNLCD